MATFTYIPTGVCSREITLVLDGNVITDISFVGGCAGNLLGIKSLVEGKQIDEVIDRLQGIPCGFKTTSCPDQLAKALIKAKEEMKQDVE